MEIQENGLSEQKIINKALIDMSNKLSIPLVATNDCHYLKKEDAFAHEVLLCIQTAGKINDPKHFKFNTDQLYFKSPDEMVEAFKDTPDAITNTTKIADRCNVEIDFKTYHFPKYSKNKSKDIDDELKENAMKGFIEKIEIIKKQNPNINEEEYKKRIKYEIQTIKDMGFSSYFLIVADFINYAEKNNIPVGPGRGSAAGSMVAYCLGITKLDPIEYGLIFERFLNPGRASMPDIDVDFCVNGRAKVFNYVKKKYNINNKKKDAIVAQITTFGTLKERGGIRDVGRALDIPLKQVDEIAKLVPQPVKNLNEALKKEPKILKLAKEDAKIQKLLDICLTLEGLTRHSSTHAAGVVISDTKLTDYMPIYKGKNKEIITQYDMHCVESLGLIKFDFLGLKNLTIIADCLRIIKEQNIDVPDFNTINKNDPKTYELLRAGNTSGVFQLESDGMISLMMRLKPVKFEDIIALVALYRPGPLESGMVDSYIARKHKKEKVIYPLPELQETLEETYGVILYQEQVMKIASIVSKYSMAEGDNLRKAMGKKNIKVMTENRKIFINKAVTNDIDKITATSLFDDIEKFAGYGFNKSHSAAYAVIAFQTAYLKAHYPIEFMAALLTNEIGNTNSIIKHIANCRDDGIEILPPSINKSKKNFTVENNNIRFGMHALKNVGEIAVEDIVKIREDKEFTNLFDFCEKMAVKDAKVNKRVIEFLIKGGAFDSTKDNRKQMLESIEKAMKYGSKMQKEKNDPQLTLFDVPEEEKTENVPKVPEGKEFESNELLALEKASLGFYLTSHPILQYKQIIKRLTTLNTNTIEKTKDGKFVEICGLVKDINIIDTKKNQKMSFVLIEDSYGNIEVVIFSKLFKKIKKKIKEDEIFFIMGKHQIKENKSQIIANSLIPINDISEKSLKKVIISIHEKERYTEELLVNLASDIKNNKGKIETEIHLHLKDGSSTKLKLSEDMKINPTDEFCSIIEKKLGSNKAIKFII